jgi:hypothetical protein
MAIVLSQSGRHPRSSMRRHRTRTIPDRRAEQTRRSASGPRPWAATRQAQSRQCATGWPTRTASRPTTSPPGTKPWPPTPSSPTLRTWPTDPQRRLTHGPAICSMRSLHPRASSVMDGSEHVDRPQWARTDTGTSYTAERKEVSNMSDRMYGESKLPVIADTTSLPADARREVLLAEYSEAAAAWRMPTDVRFKLLALIPAVVGFRPRGRGLPQRIT